MAVASDGMTTSALWTVVTSGDAGAETAELLRCVSSTGSSTSAAASQTATISANADAQTSLLLMRWFCEASGTGTTTAASQTDMIAVYGDAKNCLSLAGVRLRALVTQLPHRGLV